MLSLYTFDYEHFMVTWPTYYTNLKDLIYILVRVWDRAREMLHGAGVQVRTHETYIGQDKSVACHVSIDQAGTVTELQLAGTGVGEFKQLFCDKYQKPPHVETMWGILQSFCPHKLVPHFPDLCHSTAMPFSLSLWSFCGEERWHQSAAPHPIFYT